MIVATVPSSPTISGKRGPRRRVAAERFGLARAGTRSAVCCAPISHEVRHPDGRSPNRPPGSSEAARMLAGMNCPTCGTDVADGARYCWSCGQSLATAGDERRVVTVLFADLVGFTTMSETLDPEQVKRFVDRAFERLVADVVAFGGRVDKIIGDAIVALFGAPTAHEDDGER